VVLKLVYGRLDLRDLDPLVPLWIEVAAIGKQRSTADTFRGFVVPKMVDLIGRNQRAMTPLVTWLTASLATGRSLL
jgi:hypothetical protein